MAKNQKFPNFIVWGKIWPKRRRRVTFKFWPKLNVHIQYNMLSQIWPAPVA